MKHKMYPVINVYDLEDALIAQYGPEFIESGELTPKLFGEEFMNDCYKSFSYDELEEYTGKSWQDENYIAFINCIKTFLQDTIPGYTTVLIDVSW